MYHLANRYQDSNWGFMGAEYSFVDFELAKRKAKECAQNPICFGMVAVCASDGLVLHLYGAGGDQLDPLVWIRGGHVDLTRTAE